MDPLSRDDDDYLLDTNCCIIILIYIIAYIWNEWFYSKQRKVGTFEMTLQQPVHFFLLLRWLLWFHFVFFSFLLSFTIVAMTMNIQFRLFIATIITIYPIILSQWIQLNGKMWSNSKCPKNKYKQINKSKCFLPRGCNTYTHTHRSWIDESPVPIWIERRIKKKRRAFWSKVLELKMAGFIRTSSIKSYVNFHHIFQYYFITYFNRSALYVNDQEIT